MKTLLLVVAWLLLFAISWPLAILALALWPIVWLISIPFRIVGVAASAMLALIRALLFLPARVFGYRAN